MFFFLLSAMSVAALLSQDTLLPYMADANHCPDTLFLIAESDFRFYSADCGDHVGDASVTVAAGDFGAVPKQQSLSPVAMSDGVVVTESLSTSAPVLDPIAAVPHTAAPAASSWQGASSIPESLTGGHMRPRGEQPHAVPRSSIVWSLAESQASRILSGDNQDLKDVVHTCTLAHRHTVGEVVILSWNAGVFEECREDRFGSTAPRCSLVGVSHLGAIGLLHLLDNRLSEQWDRAF